MMTTEQLREAEENERRVRMIHVSPDQLMAVMVDARTNPEIAIRQLDLPQGYRIRAINYDHACLRFAVLVHHIEFSPVEPGYNVPVLDEFTSNRAIFRRVDD